MSNILRIDASMRKGGSVSREVSDLLISQISDEHTEVTIRDLIDGVSLINEGWIGANFTDSSERTNEQKAALAESDALISEIQLADTLVIGLPIYNFSAPAAFKAWIDQICRARVTFKYTENGPVGLLENKKAYVVVTSGGVPLGSAYDFLTGWTKQVLGFIGISDVTLIDASGLNIDAEAAIARAKDHIAQL